MVVFLLTNPSLLSSCQNPGMFLQPQQLTVEHDSAFLYDADKMMWASFICLFTSFNKHLKFPTSSQYHCNKPRAQCLGERLMMVAEWVTGVQRGPPVSVICHRGQTWARLERLRHVPREGSIPLPPPLSQPSEDSLFTPPDGGWIWGLMNAILHNSALSMAQLSLLPHADSEQYCTSRNKNTCRIKRKRRKSSLVESNLQFSEECHINRSAVCYACC